MHCGSVLRADSYHSKKESTFKRALRVSTVKGIKTTAPAICSSTGGVLQCLWRCDSIWMKEVQANRRWKAVESLKIGSNPLWISDILYSLEF